MTDSKTRGTTAFALCGSGDSKLFRINSGIPSDEALEYASNLQHCANQLVLDAATGAGNNQTLWGAFYLEEMARAIVDDVREASGSASALELDCRYDSTH
jgi:hypothetical protein